MNILIVRLTSLGDILHALPVIWDIRAIYPEANIDWLVDEMYVDLLKPFTEQKNFRGIDRIIPSNLRRFKKTFSQPKMFIKNCVVFKNFIKQLRAERYDLIIDLHGLIKSALMAFLARRTPMAHICGSANRTIYATSYESQARWFYTKVITLPNLLHAVNRSRFITQSVLGVPESELLKTPPKFYPEEFVRTLTETLWEKPYVLCFHSTARDAKRWSSDRWIAVGKALAAEGLLVIFPWGNAIEKKLSESLAAQVPGAQVPPAFSLWQAFGIIACAKLIIGIDTGLMHVAAVLSKPTVEIYCDSYRDNTDGYWSDKIKNLGDLRSPPDVEEVLAAVREINL